MFLWAVFEFNGTSVDFGAHRSVLASTFRSLNLISNFEIRQRAGRNNTNHIVGNGRVRLLSTLKLGVVAAE